MEEQKKTYKPVVLVVLDGFGEWSTKIGNPVTCADIPTINELNSYYPKLLLEASGLAVGLPWDVFGNSEVGHQTMGTGQILYHFLPTIDTAMHGGSFNENEVMISSAKNTEINNSALHIIGLLSDGGVHSHINHVDGILKFAKAQGIENVFVHVITDGRDTAQQSAAKFIQSLQSSFDRIGVGQIASICGRYFAMDRNENWDRTEKAFLAYTEGEARKEIDPIEAITKQYQEKIFDEYIEPVVMIDEQGQPIALIRDNDSIVCFNFRGDRSRQITKAFSVEGFNHFEKARQPANINYVCFAQYEEGLPVGVVFPPQEITARLGDILAKNDMKQLRIAETEKFAHVTYFFNGGFDQPFPGEDRIFVPSKNAKSYAEIPEMSAPEVTEKLLEAINLDKYDFVLVNYANTDMVGHTGDFQAGIRAIEEVDKHLRNLIDLVLEKDGCLMITADHGNIEEMVNLETGEIDTKHSTNPVPFWFVNRENKRKNPKMYEITPDSNGMLADIAPTVLDILGLEKPDSMVGWSLMSRLKVGKNPTKKE